MIRSLLKRCVYSKKCFIRHSSHYLSTRWMKEPFEIEYPVLSEATKTARKDVMNTVFPNQTLTAYDYYVLDKDNTSTSKDWDALEFEDRNEYERKAISGTPRHINPQPKPSSGIDLFQLHTKITTKNYLKKQWSRISADSQQSFVNSSNIDFLNESQERIWRGYEIVEYLKRHSAKYQWNPYPLSNLYPWEIIKDKLRNRNKVYDFEIDYYDVLIREAFYRNYQRKAQHIFFTDLLHSSPNKYTHRKVQQLFNALSPKEKEYYQSKELMRMKHAKRTKAPIRERGFRKFANLFHDPSVKPENINIAVVDCWKNLSVQERAIYEKPSSFRAGKEEFLNWKLSIVMDYIYYTGEVSGLNYNFDWRKDMKEKTKDLHYLNRMYAEIIV